jgi:hypothetical protein
MKAWIRMALGLSGAWAFVFLIAPSVREISPVKEVLDSVRENGIDAGALFYTDAEESSEAEFALRHALKSAEKD